MSNARSPRASCSTTIGTSGMGPAYAGPRPFGLTTRRRPACQSATPLVYQREKRRSGGAPGTAGCVSSGAGVGDERDGGAGGGPPAARRHELPLVHRGATAVQRERPVVEAEPRRCPLE